MRDNKRGPVQKCSWTPEEDQILIDLVSLHGPKKWSLIATSLRDRVGKQCRERWHNHLNPDVRKDAWSPEEDALIFELVEKHGTKWATIAKALHGRTDNSIKNRYYSSLKKYHDQKRSAEAEGVLLRSPSRVKIVKKRRSSLSSASSGSGSERLGVPDTVSESGSEETMLKLMSTDVVIERSPKNSFSRHALPTVSAPVPSISHIFSLNAFMSDRASPVPFISMPPTTTPEYSTGSRALRPVESKLCAMEQRRLLPLHQVHSHTLVQQTMSLNRLYELQQDQPTETEREAVKPTQDTNPEQIQSGPVVNELLEPLPLMWEYDNLLQLA